MATLTGGIFSMTSSLRVRIGALTTAVLLGCSLGAVSPAFAATEPDAGPAAPGPETSELGATGPAAPAAGEPAADEPAAGTFIVTSGENAGPGTLRAAIDAANEAPGTVTTITFADSVTTVTVTESLLSAVPLTIRGNGQDRTEIKFLPEAPEPWYLLGLDNTSVQLDALTLSGDGESFHTGVLIGNAGEDAGASSITDTLVTGFGSHGVSVESQDLTDFTMTGSTLSNNGVGLNAWRVVGGAFTVTDTVFENNVEGGLALEQFVPGAGAGATIERVRFIGNGSLDEDNYIPTAGALSLSGDLGGAAAGVTPVRIIDSTFEGNMGRSVGAIVYHPSWGEESGATEPFIRVTGSTFLGNVGGAFNEGYDARASAILLASPPMRAAAVSAAPRDDVTGPLTLRVENSTFDGSAAAELGMSPALVANGYGGTRMEFDQITAVSSTVDLIGRGPADDLTITRSVIDSGESDPLTPRSDEESEDSPGHTITVSDSVFTQPSESADLTTGTSRVLPGETLELGDLADNGGPTLTMLPADTSPLVDAVTEAGPLTTDQRGLPRPVNGQADIGALEVQEEPAAADSTVSVVADVRVANGETAVFSVERSSADAAADLPAATVTIRTADGTAVAGTDYTASEATLGWAAGETGAKTFSVPTAKRAGELPERAFTVALSEPSEGLTIVRATATATLPALKDATTPPVTPPGPDEKNDPDDIAKTGGSGPLPWAIAAALAALAGAGLIAARRRAQA